MAAVAFMAACSDVAPTEPVGFGFDQDVSLFGGSVAPVSADAATTLDGTFVRIAQENPGFAGIYYGEDGALNVVMAGTQPLSARIGGRLTGLGIDPTAQPVRGACAGSTTSSSSTRCTGRCAAGARHRRRGLHRRGRGGEPGAHRRGARNGRRGRAERAVVHAGVPSEAVIIEMTDPIELEPDAAADRVRPVAGGLQINFTRGDPPRASSARWASTCVRRSIPNVRGFVTNSHCSDTRGEVVPTPYWQHSRFVENTFIGMEALGHPVLPAAASARRVASAATATRWASATSRASITCVRPDLQDAGATGMNDGSLDYRSRRTRSSTIVDELPFPVVGQVLHKVGRTSGWTSGPGRGDLFELERRRRGQHHDALPGPDRDDQRWWRQRLAVLRARRRVARRAPDRHPLGQRRRHHGDERDVQHPLRERGAGGLDHLPGPDPAPALGVPALRTNGLRPLPI
jgi:hypothetical protein